MTTMIACDERDNGRSIDLPAGGELRLALHVNRSTAFGWRMASDGAPCLELIGSGCDLGPGAEELDGAGGTALFRFRAARPGTAEVRLEYGPDGHPPGEPVQVYVLSIAVARGR